MSLVEILDLITADVFFSFCNNRRRDGPNNILPGMPWYIPELKYLLLRSIIRICVGYGPHTGTYRSIELLTYAPADRCGRWVVCDVYDSIDSQY